MRSRPQRNRGGLTSGLLRFGCLVAYGEMRVVRIAAPLRPAPHGLQRVIFGRRLWVLRGPGKRRCLVVSCEHGIVRIDAATGRVTARIDAATLVPAGLSSSDDVLNGIAYDPADGTFLLTGKRWPTLYRATFEPTG